ncbi:uncharacterized protein LOC132069278 [Lycium ferocissimum]|uniref:uncharacterized protein LOC132069278 n=1 Tax=Lycium ferocissimum TaxID=112874 RepID=UPI002814A4DD|nr:uncharacterized protein LOC132069278 [Lycium ferocissimum]
MEMGCGRINWMVMIILWLLMPQLQEVKMEDQVVTTPKIYSCWGGCYNNCFLLKKTDDTYQCYFNCLNKCTASSSPTSSSSPFDFESICKGGCYLEICIPLSFVGANVGDCLGSCTNLCKIFSTFTKMQLED